MADPVRNDHVYCVLEGPAPEPTPAPTPGPDEGSEPTPGPTPEPVEDPEPIPAPTPELTPAPTASPVDAPEPTPAPTDVDTPEETGKLRTLNCKWDHSLFVLLLQMPMIASCSLYTTDTHGTRSCHAVNASLKPFNSAAQEHETFVVDAPITDPPCSYLVFCTRRRMQP